MIDYTPKRKMVGYGVDRIEVDINYPRFLLVTHRVKRSIR